MDLIDHLKNINIYWELISGSMLAVVLSGVHCLIMGTLTFFVIKHCHAEKKIKLKSAVIFSLVVLLVAVVFVEHPSSKENSTSFSSFLCLPQLKK